MEPQSPSKSKLSVVGWFKLYRIVKCCLFFGFIVAILVICGVILHRFGIIGKGKVYFTVVVDCGSTGTRVNVYQWMTSVVRNGDLPVLLHSYPDELMKKHVWNNGCQYHCIQTEPGLDKFVGNYSQVKASLEPLIHWAEGLVPREIRGSTPIFVLATAGLRRIPLEESKSVLDDVECVVKEHSFKWKRDWIKVLSGREEAYYGWVALNYKMGYLKNASRLPTLGLLDLGGSSLQVVVETDDIRDDNHLLVSKIGPAEHQLMAYSLPAFGLNQAFDRSVNQVKLLEKDDSSEVKHPCLGSMYVSNYSCSSCSGPDSLVHLIGDPNWERCKILAHGAAMNSSISDWSDQEVLSSCRRNSANEGKNALNLFIGTNPGVRYHALSGFFVIYTMLNLTAKANLTNIWDKAEHLCSSTWADPSNVSRSQYCFKVLYLASLIDKGLCLGSADIIFGPGDISWTLGASLVKGEHIWKTGSGLTTSQYLELVSSPIFLFIILSVLLLVVYYSQIKLPMPRKRTDIVGLPLPSYTQSNHRPL
ncbi:putative apyrase 7 [Silene latifolia]|uniref:putative apyrase 7 n=1 Tax=Silene latifolia TaxID=37657 RepID=UPI003D773F9A